MEDEVRSTALSFEERMELKKSMWSFCKRGLDGDTRAGEDFSILPQMIQLYASLFS